GMVHSLRPCPTGERNRWVPPALLTPFHHRLEVVHIRNGRVKRGHASLGESPGAFLGMVHSLISLPTGERNRAAKPGDDSLGIDLNAPGAFLGMVHSLISLPTGERNRERGVAAALLAPA